MTAMSSEALRDAAEARHAWCTNARVLAAIDDAGLPGLSITDTGALGRLPSWVCATPEARAELALLTGAVLCARRLRRTIDGRVLGGVADALGAQRMAAVSALGHRVDLPESWNWGDDPVGALSAIGAEVLIRAFDGPAPVQARLARLFEASDLLGAADAARLRRIADTALMLWQPPDPAARRAA